MRAYKSNRCGPLKAIKPNILWGWIDIFWENHTISYIHVIFMKYKIYMFYKVDWSNAFSLVATQEGTLSEELCVRMHVEKIKKWLLFRFVPFLLELQYHNIEEHGNGKTWMYWRFKLFHLISCKLFLKIKYSYKFHAQQSLL